MAERCWELPAASGRELARWTVVDVKGDGDASVFTCDVALEGDYYGATLGSGGASHGKPDDPRDFGLTIRGLQLRRDELERLAEHLAAWLDLPLAEHHARRLELTCGMGSLFDQSLVLNLGRRDDVLSGGRPVAALAYCIGRMRGEFVFVVDHTCLRILVDGIRSALC